MKLSLRMTFPIFQFGACAGALDLRGWVRDVVFSRLRHALEHGLRLARVLVPGAERQLEDVRSALMKRRLVDKMGLHTANEQDAAVAALRGLPLEELPAVNTAQRTADATRLEGARKSAASSVGGSSSGANG